MTKLSGTRAQYKEKTSTRRAIDDTKASYGFKDKFTRLGVKKAVEQNNKDGVTRLYPDLDRFHKFENEQGRIAFDIGDEVADELRDCETTDDMWDVAKGLGLPNWKDKKAEYTKKGLNVGMVRMNIGNMLRAHIKRQQKAAKAA